MTSRMRTRLAAIITGSLLSVTASAGLSAQAVVGFGDDATSLPGGMLRFGFLNSWTRWEQRFVAPDGAQIDAHARIRRTPISLELGVTNRLTMGAMAPSIGTYAVATYIPPAVTPGHADSVRLLGQSAVGDVEAWAKLVWLGHQNEVDRTNPSGVRVRSALTGKVRFGTGAPAHESHQLAIGTGDGQTDVEAASQWDFIFGRHFWMSLVGRYVYQLPTTRVTRITPRDDPFAIAALVNTRIEPGDYYELEATPRLPLGQHFMVGARYTHRHHEEATFSEAEGSGAPGGSADPSILDVASFSSQAYGFGVVYSTVASYAAGRTSIPFEVSFRYWRTDGWMEGIPPTVFAEPKRSTYAVGLRIYSRIWGER